MNRVNSSIIFAKGDIHSREIALTYDCQGRDRGGVNEVLKVLKRQSVKVNFFVTGEWVEKYPEVYQTMIDEGHEVGNHSYNHPDLVLLSPEEIKDQVNKAEAAACQASGQQLQRLFRLPYGSYNNHVLQILGEMGFRYSIHWSLDTMKWQKRTAVMIAENIQYRAKNGDVIHMDLYDRGNVDALNIIIPGLRDRGYELVTVGSMLKPLQFRGFASAKRLK